MKTQLAGRMRRTAAELDEAHPGLMTGGHLRDAALMLSSGHTDSAKRHLDAAMETLIPRSLYRHGVHHDGEHAAAKRHMLEINRHRLGVMDIEDVRTRNTGQAQARRGAQPPIQLAAIYGAAARPGRTLGWEYEKRDPHTGKWVSGPVSAGNVREHLETTHGHGHIFGSQSDEELLRSHAAMHRSGTLQGHHHWVTAGGDAERRRRQLQDTMAEASTPGAAALKAMGITAFANVDLSARTAALEATPAPRGKTGGPGLYGVKGMGHTAYLQQIVKALIEKRGMPSGKAYAVARGAIRRWASGRGHVHPEVAQAAGAAESGELARQAQARSSHGHAIGSWEMADRLIELATTAGGAGGSGSQQSSSRPQSSNWQNESRVPAGQAGGGRFGSGGGQPKGKAAPRGTRQQRRATLVRQIASIHSQIRALEAQLPASHHGARSKSSTPAKKGAAATSTRQAAASKKAASSAAKAGTKTASKTMSPATIHAKITALRAVLQADLAQLKKL